LHEASRMIVRFNGYVLKYTGDGLIAYFPAPSFNAQHDLAIDCASCLRLLIHTAINSSIKKLGLPAVEIRFGIEAGEASVVTIGSNDAKQQKDIIGSVINLAAKIQGKAAPGEIYVGEMAEQNMHTMWRRLCEPVTAGEEWPYTHSDGKPYRIYRLALKTPA
jgi:adenylate cyclase